MSMEEIIASGSMDEIVAMLADEVSDMIEVGLDRSVTFRERLKAALEEMFERGVKASRR